jgi:hypothetical protein
LVAVCLSTIGGAATARADGAPYVGNQYDYGGTRTSVDASDVSLVDSIADSIVASTNTTLDEIAQQRATLTYGGLDVPAGPNELDTYPGPAGVAASDQYSVSVSQDGASQGSFVYKSLAAKTDTNREADTSWTSFSFRGPVTVSVTALRATGLTGCLVRPYAAAIVTTFSGLTCTFTMSQPRNVSVEFEPNIHNPVVHPMLVFANPLEVDVPPASDPNVLYFGPGVHVIGSGVPITSGETIYLAGGAVV